MNHQKYFTPEGLVRLNVLAKKKRYGTSGDCESLLTNAGRSWLIGDARRVVREYHDSLAQGKTPQGGPLLDEANFESNGRRLFLTEIFNVTKYAEEKAIPAEAMVLWVFFSPLAHRLASDAALKEKIHLYMPATGLYLRSIGMLAKRDAMQLAIQVMRRNDTATRGAGAATNALQDDTVNLAALEYTAHLYADIRRHVYVELSHWLGVPEATLSRQSIKTSNWSVVMVMYGKGAHWRLLVVARDDARDRVTHILFDPLFPMFLKTPRLVVDPNHLGIYESVVDIIAGLEHVGYVAFDDDTNAAWPIIIDGIRPGIQTDGWSCGWQMMTHYNTIVDFILNKGDADIIDGLASLFGPAGRPLWTEREIATRVSLCKNMRRELYDVADCFATLVFHYHQEELTRRTLKNRE